MNDSRDFQDAKSTRSGNSHVTSRTVSFALHPIPEGMLSRSFGMPSRREGPPSIWDTHGTSRNVFANSIASSSVFSPQELNPCVLVVAASLTWVTIIVQCAPWWECWGAFFLVAVAKCVSSKPWIWSPPTTSTDNNRRRWAHSVIGRTVQHRYGFGLSTRGWRVCQAKGGRPRRGYAGGSSSWEGAHLPWTARGWGVGFAWWSLLQRLEAGGALRRPNSVWQRPKLLLSFFVLHGGVQQVYIRRWRALLACEAVRAFTASLLDRQCQVSGTSLSEAWFLWGFCRGYLFVDCFLFSKKIVDSTMSESCATVGKRAERVEVETDPRHAELLIPILVCSRAVKEWTHQESVRETVHAQSNFHHKIPHHKVPMSWNLWYLLDDRIQFASKERARAMAEPIEQVGRCPEIRNLIVVRVSTWQLLFCHFFRFFWWADLEPATVSRFWRKKFWHSVECLKSKRWYRALCNLCTAVDKISQMDFGLWDSLFSRYFVILFRRWFFEAESYRAGNYQTFFIFPKIAFSWFSFYTKLILRILSHCHCFDSLTSDVKSFGIWVSD